MNVQVSYGAQNEHTNLKLYDMNKLFASQKIENYITQFERKLQNEIDRYTEHHLGVLNVEEEVEKLFKMYKVSVPKIDTSKTSSSITTEQLQGLQLPPGTPFQMGKIYEIEIANYRIPFEGTKEFFYCTPTVLKGIVTSAYVDRNDVVVQLTNWGKISGDKEAIGKIKEELLKIIDKINENLKNLELDTEKLMTSIKPNIINYLKKKSEKVKLKNDSADELNPFK